ncbi:MAG: hypothetical protein A2312_02910 [Candidatus Staskawiczbacteria bacterium RIFOXYB2_FULL_32_9]|uniref:Uncharacterized protein n=1 Tax=Candidatus Staskawiczbacteria bacterium RIFOXYD1_FULL_32_13 TaxID=1802234 RepID=A0A1G2JRS0_9BACT|nr:MAG: hypothetical protein UR22_C0011G0031 [Parcubacteria group bacterium GW2011_GWC2_32_10]OGZ77930.1 MAG: hypothetical protein A2360_00170 [Candidatus Staskawiczbacteria bacterium RIFOXYB1_FULL_32_11]OGZ78353.1 MAG: hypothetical protein A2256_04165 [Candidatus Staskawiczbacteria bacterium RIFOXYA2_FULL_32_7]OGZ83512.1 MAG: hypothetical protein A2312_02910 [Candidatus Staskawiczbacteria bacterium RIFOXYB2_FULL_32_9]OGZ87465.1 MAG: hypothetical protein A2463_04875 [Candidatus Staskawiczbacter
MENFNDKVWYRLLKVIFIIAFVFFQVVSCIIVFEIYGTKEIAPQSFQEVGKLVKYVYGEYNDLSDELVGKNLYENNISAWFDFASSSGKSDFKNVNGKQWRKVNIDYQDKYTTQQKLLYCLIPFLIISVIFWFISRLFFYIFIKENFFSGKLVNLIRKPFIKK